MLIVTLILANIASFWPPCCLVAVFSQLNHMDAKHIMYTTSYSITTSSLVPVKGSISLVEEIKTSVKEIKCLSV